MPACAQKFQGGTFPVAHVSATATPFAYPHHALTRWERRGLYCLLAVVVLFGGLVEFRSGFLNRRMGDLEVFARAAWAVRTGHDIYVITDSKGFHYHYPPLFAILMAPLADAPAGAERIGLLPFRVSVLLWYLCNLGCLGLSVHWLAGAVEQGRPVVRYTRRWWALRVIPVLACLPSVGGSLMRGQVDLLLLLLLSGMIVAAVRGQNYRAGLWLAGAICLKVIPAFLLIYPCWRRDGRWLAGSVCGLLAGLIFVPALVFGPRQTLAYYNEWHEVLVQPALVDGGNQSRAKELIDVTATDSQSFLAVAHNTLHLDRSRRPTTASAAVRIAHWSTGSLLTMLTLLAATWPGWHRQSCLRSTDRYVCAASGFTAVTSAVDTQLLLGGLIVLMALLSPVCHLHYFALSIPLALGLVAVYWDRRPQHDAGIEIGMGLRILFAFNIVANVLPKLPGLEVFRDLGIAMYAALALWLNGCLALSRRSKPTADRAFARAA